MSKLKSISAIVFALYSLLAGNGVNLIQFCSCCPDHSSNHDTVESCNHLADFTHKCHLKRYTLDDGQELPSNISLQILMTVVSLPNFSARIAYASIIPNKNFPSIGYVHDSGRNLLSHICVLTI
ncbi:MAG: hypothetical protein LBI82_06870 [Dysgonamonadaceae bacterium]|jgi:hypothetical protein|nr:hypothetical protein [Dysgonamonadaceae bacterium]